MSSSDKELSALVTFESATDVLWLRSLARTVEMDVLLG